MYLNSHYIYIDFYLLPMYTNMHVWAREEKPLKGYLNWVPHKEAVIVGDTVHLCLSFPCPANFCLQKCKLMPYNTLFQ